MLGVTFGLGKILRDCSLTCSVGYRWAPAAILAVAFFSLPVSGLHARWVRHQGFRGLQTRSLLLAGFSFLAFRLLTFAGVEWQLRELDAGTFGGPGGLVVKFSYLAFYVWLGAVSALLGPNAKLVVTRLHPKERHGQALALGGAAVVAGALLGSAAAGGLVPLAISIWGLRYEHARDLLLFGMAAAMFVTIPIIGAIDRRLVDTKKTVAARAVRPVNLLGHLRHIVRSRSLRKLGLLIVLTGIAETVLLFAFYWLVSEQTAPANGRTAFFASYYLWVNGATLLLLLFVSDRAISRLGLLVVLLTLPVTLLFGAVYLLLQTALVVIYVLRITEESLEKALYDQGLDRAILTTGLGGDDAHVLLGLVPRLGRGAGAILVFLLAVALELRLAALLGVYLAIVVVWIATALTLRSELRVQGEAA